MFKVVCEKDTSRIPEKYKRASTKKIARKLKKMPPPTLVKKELVIKTSRGTIIF